MFVRLSIGIAMGVFSWQYFFVHRRKRKKIAKFLLQMIKRLFKMTRVLMVNIYLAWLIDEWKRLEQASIKKIR